MIQLTNNLIVIACYICILYSYKIINNRKKGILLLLILFVTNTCLESFIQPICLKSIYVLIIISLNYLIIKLIHRADINILDMFYMTYLYFIYILLNSIAFSNMIIIVFLLCITLCCSIWKRKLKDLNNKIICIWNGNTENSLRLRCIFIISFNLIIYMVCRIIN